MIGSAPTPAPRRRAPWGAIALGGAAMLALSACMPAVAGLTGSHQPPASAPVIKVSAAHNDNWRPNRPVRVSVDGGTVQEVSITSSSGESVTGRMKAHRTRWVSSPHLSYGTRYTVHVKAADHSGVTAQTEATFRTQQPKALVNTYITPGRGVFGVGMPIIVSFTKPVPNKAAAQRALSVTTSPQQTGGWYWVGDQMVRWRPKTYWQPGTKVQVKANLKGVDLGKGVWGGSDNSSSFSIGQAMISTVNIGDHTLTVRRDGQVLRTIPVTTGKPGWDTRIGIKVIMSKQYEVTMNASTIDVPKNSPNWYRLKVYWDMRLTWSGEFLHAAPWSVAYQGHENVSHGCTGMSTADAQWLYENSHVGDVVDYVNGVKPMEPWNGYTDWNIPWSQWQQGSALN